MAGAGTWKLVVSLAAVVIGFAAMALAFHLCRLGPDAATAFVMVWVFALCLVTVINEHRPVPVTRRAQALLSNRFVIGGTIALALVAAAVQHHDWRAPLAIGLLVLLVANEKRLLRPHRSA
jgi:MFS family permease